MRLCFLVLSLLLFVSGTAYAQELKIGYIDLQSVIRDSKAGKAAKASFEAEFKKKRDIIESKRAQLDRLKNKFAQNGSIMNEDTRKQKAGQIQRLDKDLQRATDDFREELQRRDFELLEKILKDLDGILKSVGKSNGYTMIIDKSEGGLVYGNPSVDVTQQVIKAYDAKN